MKRKILMGLAVLAALTVSGVLLASSSKSGNPCDETVSPGCVSKQDQVCYYFLQNRSEGGSSGATDRCFWRDHDFAGGGGGAPGGM